MKPIEKIADAFRAGRAQVAGNMAVSIGGGLVSLTLHSTTVVIQDVPNGTITFNSGGNKTVTTAKAINAVLNAMDLPPLKAWTWRGVAVIDGHPIAIDPTASQASGLSPALSR